MDARRAGVAQLVEDGGRARAGRHEAVVCLALAVVSLLRAHHRVESIIVNTDDGSDADLLGFVGAENSERPCLKSAAVGPTARLPVAVSQGTVSSRSS